MKCLFFKEKNNEQKTKVKVFDALNQMLYEFEEQDDLKRLCSSQKPTKYHKRCDKIINFIKEDIEENSKNFKTWVEIANEYIKKENNFNFSHIILKALETSKENIDLSSKKEKEFNKLKILFSKKNNFEALNEFIEDIQKKNPKKPIMPSLIQFEVTFNQSNRKLKEMKKEVKKLDEEISQLENTPTSSVFTYGKRLSSKNMAQFQIGSALKSNQEKLEICYSNIVEYYNVGQQNLKIKQH